MDFAKLKRKQRIERMRREHADRADVVTTPLPAILAGRDLPSASKSPLIGIMVRVREIQLDLLYSDAKEALMHPDGKSVPALQRELRIGYDRAKQLIEDVTIGRYIIEVRVQGVGWVSAGVVLATGWHRVEEAIRCLDEEVSSINTKSLWRGIQRALGLNWKPPWETK